MLILTRLADLPSCNMLALIGGGLDAYDPLYAWISTRPAKEDQPDWCFVTRFKINACVLCHRLEVSHRSSVSAKLYAYPNGGWDANGTDGYDLLVAFVISPRTCHAHCQRA